MNQVATTIPQDLTQQQQQAWLGLARGKNAMVTKLNERELQAQKILLALPEDYKIIDDALAAYRKEHTEMVELRKEFTSAIDAGIIQPLMAFEKRVDPKSNTRYIELTAKSLSLRKAETEKAEMANRKNQEIARFKAFVENEFFRVAAEYRSMLRREISAQYKLSLDAKIMADLTLMKDLLRKLAIPPIQKFQTALLSQEEMKAAYEALRKPDFERDYNDGCDYIDEVFANFESDLANSEAAIKNQQEQTKLEEMEEQKKLAEEQAMTTLIATAETVVIETPKIKKTLQVVVVESEQWVKSVVAAFIVNMPHLGKHIKVKKWSNLTVGQMAAALGALASETGITFTNIQLKEVEK